jgi:DNA repair exonuclease SbcCD ATPase subunit
MKITAIQTSNFLGARAIDVGLTKPVTLFAGKNGAGKSSLQEAIRMALTGETVRVDLKKDYGALVTEGQEAGFVEVETADASYSVVLPSGKGSHSDIPALPYVLDAQRFARLDDKERRAFLFGLMGVKLDGASVKQRMLDKGLDAGKVEQIMPFLRAGFDAAQKEAAARARDAKASWKTVTGGETWGKDKAAKWQPAPLPGEAEKARVLHENAVARMREIEQELGAAQQALGAAKAKMDARERLAAQRSELAEKAGRIERIKAKLECDEADLKRLEEKVADLKGAAKPQSCMTCPDCGARLAVRDGALVHANPTDKGTEDDLARLPEYEKSLKLMQSAVANDKRDLAEAEQAALRLQAMEAETAEAIDIEPLAARVAEVAKARDGWRADADKYRAMAEAAVRRQAVIEQAAALHADVLAWTAIADALAPDGIPGEMLAEALGPINDRLRESARLAEWEQVEIHADMRITYGGRDYALISESEKWRADAMIAEAVSHLSGLKLLVLDRFDVLDMNGREDMIYWIGDLAARGEIDTALVFGTLKALPAKLPEQVESYWIENGVAGQIKEAA